MPNQTDIRQLRARATLDRTTAAANSSLDTIVQALNKEITPPFAMSVAGGTRTVAIGAPTVVNPTTEINKTISPISGLIPNGSWSVVVDATGAGNATPSSGAVVALGMTANQVMRLGINVDASGALTLTKGTAAANFGTSGIPPVPSGLYPIGYVVVQTDGSNLVSNFLRSNLYQYQSGGSSGGSGTGNTALETLKNMMVDSPFELMTPIVIQTDGSSKIATLTGAAYDIVTSTIKFTANAQVATTVQLLDTTEFLSRGLDVNAIDLVAIWNQGSSLQALSTPAAFTYEISRDGGTNWFTVPMSQVGSTNTFRGPLRFDTTTTTEASTQTIVTQATQDANRSLNATTQQSMSQAFTLAATTKLQTISLSLAKAGSPTGNLYVSVIRDSSGSPSTTLTDLLCQSNAVLISGLAAGPATVVVDIPDVTLTAGTYHVVVTTDATYKTIFSAGVTEVRLRERQTGSSIPYTKSYNGTTWATASGNGNLTLTIAGRALDLRARITSAGSPTYPCGLDAIGVFYNLQDVGAVGGVRKTQRFVFNSVTDNTSSFTISAFSPDPDLLSCFWVEGGQVFKVPAFSLNGAVATFPADTFKMSGVSQTITLIFDQNGGASFDGSDSNARLLAANYLGSTSGIDDRSANGRGPAIRDAAGTLREVSLNSLGYPVVKISPNGSVLRDVTTASTMDDATATRMGLKSYFHGTAYNGGNAPTVTASSSGSWTNLRSMFIPYQMQDGTWRLRFNIMGSFSGTSSGAFADVAVNGISLNNEQAMAVWLNLAQSSGGKVFGTNSFRIYLTTTSTYNISAYYSGDIELASKPTWAY